MRLSRIQPPAAEPVTLDEAKYQCKDRHTQADAALTRAIRAARELAEQRTGRALITQQWRQTEPCAPTEIRLRVWPVTAVDKVTVDGVDLTPADYTAYLGDDPRLLPNGDVVWQGRRVDVEYTAGYGASGDDVPAPITRWMLHQIANAHEHSGSVVLGISVSELTFVDHLLDPWIVPR